MKTSFRIELEKLINRESMENGSDTPDFILAEYLCDCLEVFDRTMSAREKWYGREPAKARPWVGLKEPEKNQLAECMCGPIHGYSRCPIHRRHEPK